MSYFGAPGAPYRHDQRVDAGDFRIIEADGRSSICRGVTIKGEAVNIVFRQC
jgi:hypothetical protein